MVIMKERKDKWYKVIIEGSIDSTTAPQFSEALEDLEGVEKLVLDFEKVEYISSAGIRVILAAYKSMNKKDAIKLVKVNKSVYSALFITGFADKICIERAQKTE